MILKHVPHSKTQGEKPVLADLAVSEHKTWPQTKGELEREVENIFQPNVPEESRIGELSNSSSSISFDCSGGAFKVGSSSAPASLGAMVLPSAFKGSVTVECEGGVKATFTVDQTLKAGVVNHISLDMANAEVEGLKHMPTRLGILGDSICWIA